MNFDRLRHVSERAELGEEREAVLAAIIPERPGSFKASVVCWAPAILPNSIIACKSCRGRGLVGVQVQSREECAALIATLQAHDVRAFRLQQ